MIVHADCLDHMATMDAESVDSIVTDPPYGIAFMGKDWDHEVPGVPYWEAALRVAKPGAYLLAFGGTRLYHRLTVAIEDAGWEVRDCLMWLYGSGFPKSHDVSKAIDKAAGHWRGRAGAVVSENGSMSAPNYERTEKGDPITPAAQQWSGWGTALKPAWEPIIMARKPFKGTVAANVLEHGTGAINVDGCRISYEDEADRAGATPQGKVTSKNSDSIAATPDAGRGESRVEFDRPEQKGRFPANLILDDTIEGEWTRYFYCPKASKADRTNNGTVNNPHPTVKPHDLMRYLCRMVTQPGGLVFDPFTGSGSTGRAALAEGFRFLGCEKDADNAAVAAERIA